MKEDNTSIRYTNDIAVVVSLFLFIKHGMIISVFWIIIEILQNKFNCNEDLLLLALFYHYYKLKPVIIF